jgi:hypothetical protein
MKHIAQIQTEFLKIARKWDDLSYEEQVAYLKRHKKSKRKITAKPEAKREVTEKSERNETIETTDDADIKLTKVQKKVFDACEPLIVDLQDRAERYYDSVLQRFEEYKKTHQDERSYDSMVRFAGRDSELTHFLRSVYKQTDPKSFLSLSNLNVKLKDMAPDDALKQAYYKRMKEQIREYNTYKLSRALHKYVTSEFKDIKNVEITRGTNGFEVFANLIDDQDRTWKFETKAIGAGGYNIQVWHYRYIINLSSREVPRDVVRRRVSEQEKQEKEQKREQRRTEHLEKKRLKAAKRIASLFSEVKSGIKDWDEWEKLSLQDQIRDGHRQQQELDDKERVVTRMKDFIRKYNYKRPELTKKILDGEITLSTFDAIKDLLTNSYGYRNLQSAQRRGEL